jgi:sirohydrochlorin ferrochelatase
MPETQKPPLIDERLAEELTRYKGQWVAVHNGHVVASGGSANEALQAARQAGVTDPLIFRVTAHPERLSLL